MTNMDPLTRLLSRHALAAGVFHSGRLCGVFDFASDESPELFDVVYTTTRGGPLGASQTVVYYVYYQFRELQRFGYASAVAYGLFAVTMLLTLAMVVYARRRGEAFAHEAEEALTGLPDTPARVKASNSFTSSAICCTSSRTSDTART